MQTPLNCFRVKLIKYLEINVSGKGEKPVKTVFQVSQQKCAIPTVLHREAATWEDERCRRPEALQQPGGRSSPRLLGAAARPGWGQRCSRGGPKGGRKGQVSPPLPLPSAQNAVPRPPTSPLTTKRETGPSPAPLKLYRSFSVVGAAGLCRPPIQATSLRSRRTTIPIVLRAPRRSPSRRHALPVPPRTAPGSAEAGAGEGLSTRGPHHGLACWRPSPSDSLPRCRRSADRFAAGQVGWGWGTGRSRRGVR